MKFLLSPGRWRTARKAPPLAPACNKASLRLIALPLADRLPKSCALPRASTESSCLRVEECHAVGWKLAGSAFSSAQRSPARRLNLPGNFHVGFFKEVSHHRDIASLRRRPQFADVQRTQLGCTSIPTTWRLRSEPPHLNGSTAMFRKRRKGNGARATEAGGGRREARAVEALVGQGRADENVLLTMACRSARERHARTARGGSPAARLRVARA
jgi:hypothetical protein